MWILIIPAIIIGYMLGYEHGQRAQKRFTDYWHGAYCQFRDFYFDLFDRMKK